VAAHSSSTDTDGDGRTDAAEYVDGTDPNDGNYDSWAIPYFEKFASGANGQALATTFSAFTWLAGTATITDTHLTAMSDNLGIALSAGGLKVGVTNSAGSNVFCQVYVKPVACVEIPSNAVTTAEAAAVCVVTNRLYVYNDTGWAPTSIFGPHLTNGTTWIGLAAHLVYDGSGGGTWDLYYTDDNEFSSEMTKVNTDPYLFNTSYGGAGLFTELIMKTESTVVTHVDAVAVSLSSRPTHTDYTNLVIFERSGGAESVAAKPPYHYATSLIATNVGATDLGRDLSIGLFENDEINDFLEN
jgi:hypothetical protein